MWVFFLGWCMWFFRKNKSFFPLQLAKAVKKFSSLEKWCQTCAYSYFLKESLPYFNINAKWYKELKCASPSWKLTWSNVSNGNFEPNWESLRFGGIVWCFKEEIYQSEIGNLPIRNHQHELPYLHQEVYCLALNHNEQLGFGNGDEDILMHKQHQ